VLLPEVNLLDLAGPVQVFDAATVAGASYRVEYAAKRTEVVSAQGLTLAALAPLPHVAAGDLVLVPGPRLHPPVAGEPLAGPTVTGWLRAAHAIGARIVAVCTGAAALGEAGLLDGRRCTTHWQLIEAMRHRYRRARVQDDVLYVHDGQVSTSAGIAAGIDLALSIVERDHGPLLAATVARTLVVYLRRPGSGTQISPFLRHRDHLHPGVHRVQDHLAQHLAVRFSLTQLAEVASLSPRGLSRAFTVAVGMTPLEYHQELRMEHATNLLRETDLPVEAVALRCGFPDPRHFRRTYAARRGTAPSAVRHG
jgi:transcriptional regulator GlxA family with amidase domain